MGVGLELLGTRLCFDVVLLQKVRSDALYVVKQGHVRVVRSTTKIIFLSMPGEARNEIFFPEDFVLSCVQAKSGGHRVS